MATRKSNNPLTEHILPFLEYCEVEKGLSNNTQRNYQQYLRRFTHWLRATNQPHLKPHELTPEHIWNYRLYLARKYKAPRGQRLSKKITELLPDCAARPARIPGRSGHRSTPLLQDKAR
ncbi:MAG: phage integrase N-terminal SAM-like domain-containing protein [Rhodomicrobiaceae bacterium]